jgi:hypothetical protein
MRKLSSWAVLLWEYQFDVEHIAGRNNELSDAHSQLPTGETFQDVEKDIEWFLFPARVHSFSQVILTYLTTNALEQRIVEEERADSWLTVIVAAISLPPPQHRRGSR